MNYLGIDNVLLLRGDPIKTESHFTPEEGGNVFALDLVQQVGSMNKGIFLDEDLRDVDPTTFCIGVAGYPEKHFESPNLDTDIQFTLDKVKAGASYIVTQMFYDNENFFKYVDACRAAGITVPIVPGLKPITRKYQLNSIPRKFSSTCRKPLSKK